MSNSLTKTDIVQIINEDLGFNKREARELLDLFLAVIGESLASGRHVKLAEFGKFVLHNKPSRPGRNPKTGEDADISARRVVSFQSSRNFKKRLRGSR